jgi:hypothetical protein
MARKGLKWRRCPHRLWQISGAGRPFADPKEQLGGYFIIEVADLDAAIDWAKPSPSAKSALVEVRTVTPTMAPPAR